MAPVTSFRSGLKLALEASRGAAPGASQWYAGGRWFDIITDGIPGITNQQAIIFPSGHAGRRSMNQSTPVLGRKWSDGDFSANVVADYLGVILKAAFGSVSSNSVPSTDNSLLEGEGHGGAGATKSMVLANQPSDGGAILELVVLGTSTNGTLAVSGINAQNEGASEVISFTSAGSYYTRNSFSAVGPSSLVMTSNNPASVSVHGFKYFEHTFSASDQDPTLSIQRVGTPMAGDPSGSAFMHTGMVLQDLTLNTAAGDREGIFSLDSSWEGNFGATCTAQALNHASSMRVWPAWTQSVTRDGANYHKITNSTLNINTGNRNYRAAAGNQNPQGSFFGGREATTSMDVLVDDQTEYQRWLGLSKTTLVFDWTTPWKLTSSDYMKLEASMNSAYIENISEGEDDEALSLSVDVRSIDDADTNVLKFKLKNGVPPYPYSD